MGGVGEKKQGKPITVFVRDCTDLVSSGNRLGQVQSVRARHSAPCLLALTASRACPDRAGAQRTWREGPSPRRGSLNEMPGRFTINIRKSRRLFHGNEKTLHALFVNHGSRRVN